MIYDKSAIQKNCYDCKYIDVIGEYDEFECSCPDARVSIYIDFVAFLRKCNVTYEKKHIAFSENNSELLATYCPFYEK